jgi:outer membrane protein TolC
MKRGPASSIRRPSLSSAKAELTESEASLADALRNLKVAQRNLDRQMGRSGYDIVVATGSLEMAGLPAEPDYTHATENHPSTQLAEAGVFLSEAQVKAAQSSLWPSLSASYQRSFTGDNYFPGDPHWSLSGVLRYPIFSGGLTSTYYGVSSARRSLEKSREDLRSVEYQVRNRLESTWATLAGRVDQIKVQSEFLEAARQRNDEAVVRYSSGLMTFENWEIVVSDLVNFERSTIRAQRDAVVAEADWNLAMGISLEE